MRPLVRHIGKVQRLVVFEAAARLGSFTAAAHELGMTQPAVTRQIRAFEQSVRIELFRRSANRSELTDSGRRLHLQISRGFALIENALDEIATRQDVFVLACPPGLAQQWLMPRIDQLQHILGGHELRLWLFDRDEELEAGVFDAAIRVGDGQFGQLSAHLLFPESTFPVAAPGLARSSGLSATTTPGQLLDAQLLHMDDGDRPWMSWSEWFAKFGLDLPRRSGRVFFNNYPMVLQQAVAGRGVALGWRHLVDEMVVDGVLVQVGPEVRSHRGYYLTWPSSGTTATVTALLGWTLDQISKIPD